MARPRKCRKVCCLPKWKSFASDSLEKQETIQMTVEEYESIRLMDWEGMDQKECAEFMHISRSTFQRIYQEARKKMADYLVNGKKMIISGGDYQTCLPEQEKLCKKKCWKEEVDINEDSSNSNR